MNLVEFDKLLDRLPVMARLNPVSLAFLDRPVTLYRTAREMALTLDTLNPTPPGRWLTLDIDTHYLSRFPEIKCEHDPFTSESNRILLDRYDQIGQSMLTQDKVAQRIISRSAGLETVVLFLLDGLSYDDCRAWPGVEPCLTVLPTITRVCFPAIVNNPPIASRLFTNGFSRRIGFTYWERQDNQLTDKLFETIGDMHEIRTGFGEVARYLSKAPDLRQTYIQIVRSALDDYADGIRTLVPRDTLVHELWDDIATIADVLRKRGLRARIFAVADHGLLWKDQNHPFQILGQERGGLRHGPTKPPNSRGKWVSLDSDRSWVLDYPQLHRDFRNNEQGTHGGISFEECVVPFFTLEVQPDA
jgi:hypothetical protein